MQTGRERKHSHARLLSTQAWRYGGEARYALEGSVFTAGAAVQWLRDGLKLIPTSAAVEPLAASVPDAGGLVLVPAFTGLGAPYWDPDARGTLLGISRGTTAAHIARATLEGIALQVVDVVEAMQRDAELELKELRVDGGASANNLLMQLQADLLGIPVVRPRNAEATVLGAAYPKFDSYGVKIRYFLSNSTSAHLFSPLHFRFVLDGKVVSGPDKPADQPPVFRAWRPVSDGPLLCLLPEGLHPWSGWFRAP